MKKALADRAETLKVVSEQLKAPVPVLDTYLLKDNDFGRDPGAAPNFEAIQKMLDIYAATGMLPKVDGAQFKHPTIVGPLQKQGQVFAGTLQKTNRMKKWRSRVPTDGVERAPHAAYMR